MTKNSLRSHCVFCAHEGVGGTHCWVGILAKIGGEENIDVYLKAVGWSAFHFSMSAFDEWCAGLWSLCQKTGHSSFPAPPLCYWGFWSTHHQSQPPTSKKMPQEVRGQRTKGLIYTYYTRKKGWSVFLLCFINHCIFHMFLPYPFSLPLPYWLLPFSRIWDFM